MPFHSHALEKGKKSQKIPIYVSFVFLCISNISFDWSASRVYSFNITNIIAYKYLLLYSILSLILCKKNLSFYFLLLLRHLVNHFVNYKAKNKRNWGGWKEKGKRKDEEVNGDEWNKIPIMIFLFFYSIPLHTLPFFLFTFLCIFHVLQWKA